jgi:hypothetical protein
MRHFQENWTMTILRSRAGSRAAMHFLFTHNSNAVYVLRCDHKNLFRSIIFAFKIFFIQPCSFIFNIPEGPETSKIHLSVTILCNCDLLYNMPFIFMAIFVFNLTLYQIIARGDFMALPRPMKAHKLFKDVWPAPFEHSLQLTL